MLARQLDQPEGVTGLMLSEFGYSEYRANLRRRRLVVGR